jgi:hypothetical protein
MDHLDFIGQMMIGQGLEEYRQSHHSGVVESPSNMEK